MLMCAVMYFILTITDFMLGFAKKPNDGYYPAEVSIYFKFELVHVISPAARN